MGKGSAKHGMHSKNKDEFTRVFAELRNQPREVTTEQTKKIERFICQLYGVAENSIGPQRLSKFQKSTYD